MGARARSARPTTGGFDGLPGRVAARVMARMNADMERAALDALDPRPGARVLVVGFGPGVGLDELTRRVPDARVVGIDPSGVMVGAARRRLPSEAQVELHALGVEAVDPRLGCFDAAVAVNCHQCFEPHDVAVRALAGVLRPGGRFVSLTHDWAIERRLALPAWRARVERDTAAAGFDTPTWSSAHYRSGAATLLVVEAGGRARAAAGRS